MNRYLLDTIVVSELRKRNPHGALVAWLRGLHEDQVFFSALTMGELQAGIELTRVQDANKASEIELWVDQLAASYQILPMDTSCFREWGRLMHGKSDRLIEDLSITHKLSTDDGSQFDIGQAGQASPHYLIAGRRIVGTGKIARAGPVWSSMP